MRIKNQDEILSLQTRKKIITDIESSENRLRKQEAYRRAQCFRDKTNQEVVKVLSKQFSAATVDEMSYAITNISLAKKVIKKLARVYKDGVKRTAESDQITDNIRKLAELLKINQKLKTQDRFTRLQRNAAMYIKPCKARTPEGEDIMRPRPTVLQPYLYDVVEDYYDRTEPMVYILSNFQPNDVIYAAIDPGTSRDNTQNLNYLNGQQRSVGNRRDEAIADKKEDEEQADGKEYIWWSDDYHFTTNSLGQRIDQEGNADSIPELSAEDENVINPIEELPFINTAIDQDNSFWAEGGEDLIDSSIVVNSMMTQNNHIAVVQGYGQFYMTGKNLPENVIVGPNSIIKLEYDSEGGDPTPTVGSVSANPPLTELQNSITTQVALTLSMNNLSTSGVSSSLDGGAAFPSGVAMLIDKSESMEDVNDGREMFTDAERSMWRIIAKFMQVFSSNEELDPKLAEYIIPAELDLTLEFNEPNVIQTEAEKLAAIATRKDIGLNTDEELIIIDRGADYDETQAAAKLAEIRQQRMDRMTQMTVASPFSNENEDDNEDDSGDQDDQD